MVSREIVISSPEGLHLAQAEALCNEADEYRSVISLQKDGRIFNAKSMIGVLGACIRHGDRITVICEGADEKTALEGVLSRLEYVEEVC